MAATMGGVVLDSGVWDTLRQGQEGGGDKMHVTQNAVTKQGAVDVLVRSETLAGYGDKTFSNKPKKEGKATSQKASGRCWIFAALNCIRAEMRSAYKLPEDFELSQSYLFFFDKLERCSYFFNAILDTRHLPLDSREVQFLLSNPLNDGGQWDMVVNLIEKYGVVPKSAYPESHASSNSRAMNRFLTSLLRQYARELREQQGDTQAAQRVYLQHIYRALCIYMGTPPQSFSWRYYDKDGAFHVVPDLTPVSFYRDHARVSVKDYVSLIHDPRNPYGAVYSVKYLGNVLGGLRPVVRHLNVDMADIRRYCVQQLEAQRPVWFGCDSGKDFYRKVGVWDDALFDYEAVFDVAPSFSKAERLLYGESLMTHAMVITGFHRDTETAPVTKWRIENSWGTEHGDSGYCTMSDSWFEQFVYQVVVPRDQLDPEHQRIHASDEMTVLPPWDPMGALAVTE